MVLKVKIFLRFVLCGSVILFIPAVYFLWRVNKSVPCLVTDFFIQFLANYPVFL